MNIGHLNQSGKLARICHVYCPISMITGCTTRLVLIAEITHLIMTVNPFSFPLPFPDAVPLRCVMNYS